VLGYLSHILADMLTPAGVPLLWPCRWRFRLPIRAAQRQPAGARCVWRCSSMPSGCRKLAENSAVRWSSGMINSLQSPLIALLVTRLDDKQRNSHLVITHSI
jgi:inner membrane protein